MEFKIFFDVSNCINQYCIFAHVVFVLFFSIILHLLVILLLVFNYNPVTVRESHQQFKSETFIRTSIIHDHLFADDSVLIVTSIEKMQELINNFSNHIRVNQKFCNILLLASCSTYIMWLKLFMPWITPTEVGSIVVDGALTHI